MKVTKRRKDIKASIDLANSVRFTENSGKTKYKVIHTDCEEMNSMEALAKLEGQITLIRPYDEAEYTWAYFKNGIVHYIQDGKEVDKSYYTDADDNNLEVEVWIDNIVGDIMDNLDDMNKDVKEVIVHNSTDVEEDELERPEQQYSSSETSINSSKLPAVYRLISIPEGSVGVDFGGGKFDNAVEHIRDLGATLCVYDPYNRSAEHNREVLKTLRQNGGADWAINSNVLNVIKEPAARKAVLENIKKITKSGAPVYITVYEGNGKGEGNATKAGYQLNRKTADYLEEIQEVFPDAKRRGKLITAHNSRSVESSTSADSYNPDTDYSALQDELWNKLKEVATSEEFGFGPEEIHHYFRVDPIFEGDMLRIEVGAEVDYDGMETIKEALDPIIESWCLDAYFDFECPGILSAYIPVNIEASTDVEGEFSWNEYRKNIELGDVEESDDVFDWRNYFNKISSQDVAEQAGIEVDELITAEDLKSYGATHIAWLEAKPEFSAIDDEYGILELVDDGEEFIAQISGDRLIDVTEEVVEYLNDLNEVTASTDVMCDYLDPPEYDDPEEISDRVEYETDFNVIVTIDDEGYVNYDNEEFLSSDLVEDYLEWYVEDTGDYVNIRDQVSMIEDFDELMLDELPDEPGQYKVSGNIVLVYDMWGVYYYGQDYDLDTDRMTIKFQKKDSTLSNLVVEKM